VAFFIYRLDRNVAAAASPATWFIGVSPQGNTVRFLADANSSSFNRNGFGLVLKAPK
jgi:hypothetical protein